MLTAKALVRPDLVFNKIRQYGFGRTVMDFTKRYPALTWHVRPAIRAAKILREPFGYMRRKRLARNLVAASKHKGFFPHSQAFIAAPPGTFEAIEDILPPARSIVKKYFSIYPDGKDGEGHYAYLLRDFESGKPDDGITDLRRYPEFQDLALHRPFIEIASEYLGEIPIIGSCMLQITMPNDKTEGFQRYHIDRIDRRQLKIFIAIEDVDEDNGATIIVPADISKKIAQSLNHRFGRIPDEVIHSENWSRHINRAAGPAGSAFFFDTCRVVHCGARARTKPRIIIQLQYVSRYCYAEPPSQLGKVIFDRTRARDEIDILALS